MNDNEHLPTPEEMREATKTFIRFSMGPVLKAEDPTPIAMAGIEVLAGGMFYTLPYDEALDLVKRSLFEGLDNAFKYKIGENRDPAVVVNELLSGLAKPKQ